MSLSAGLPLRRPTGTVVAPFDTRLATRASSTSIWSIPTITVGEISSEFLRSTLLVSDFEHKLRTSFPRLRSSPRLVSGGSYAERDVAGLPTWFSTEAKAKVAGGQIHR